MRTWVFPAVLLLVVLIPIATSADDTLVTLAAGGLIPIKTTQIAMESEDLHISVGRITVRYVFRNNSAKDIDAVVAFPLPDLAGEVLYPAPVALPNENNINFVDFSVTSGGKPIPTKVESRAFLKGRDITARLQSLGLSPSVLLGPLKSAIQKLNPDRRSELVKEGLIVSPDSQTWLATWTMRVKFYWTQRFPAHSEAVLVQTYRPVVGGGYITEDMSGADFVRPFCGGPGVLRRIKQGQHPYTDATSGDVAWMGRNINFILTTANNWSGPIRRFRLVVTSSGPQDILTTCMPGLKRLTSTTYELVRRDFHPKHDLKLLILQPNR